MQGLCSNTACVPFSVKKFYTITNSTSVRVWGTCRFTASVNMFQYERGVRTLSVDCVSSTDAGVQLQMIAVFEFPPREFCSIRVSFESR